MAARRGCNGVARQEASAWSADDLRSLLAGPIGGDTARIGSVSLRDSHAHVRVPEELVDAIIAGVQCTADKDYEVTVEPPARPIER